jgi:hypothetical protein
MGGPRELYGSSNIVRSSDQPIGEIFTRAEVFPPPSSVDSDSDTESATVTRKSHGHESTTADDVRDCRSSGAIEQCRNVERSSASRAIEPVTHTTLFRQGDVNEGASGSTG